MNPKLPALALLILVELGLIGRALFEWFLEATFTKSTDAAPAEITGHYAQMSYPGGRTYHIDYQYAANGTSYDKHQQISRHAFERLSPDDTLRVSYLPAYPGQSRLSGEYTDHTQRNTYSLYAVKGAALIVVILLLTAGAGG